MKKARVIYNETNDSFDIEINTGDGWGLETSYKCHASAKFPMGETNFISWRILAKLADLQELGYTTTIKV